MIAPGTSALLLFVLFFLDMRAMWVLLPEWYDLNPSKVRGRIAAGAFVVAACLSVVIALTWVWALDLSDQ